MTPKQFLKRMADPRLNLSALARKSGIDRRVLVRLRTNPPEHPRQATIDAVAPFIAECRE